MKSTDAPVPRVPKLSRVPLTSAKPVAASIADAAYPRRPGARYVCGMRPARLHLVDGTYELFRAHYSKRNDHRAPAGWDAKATVGVVSWLLALLTHPAEAVGYLAVAYN